MARMKTQKLHRLRAAIAAAHADPDLLISMHANGGIEYSQYASSFLYMYREDRDYYPDARGINIWRQNVLREALKVRHRNRLIVMALTRGNHAKDIVS